MALTTQVSLIQSYDGIPEETIASIFRDFWFGSNFEVFGMNVPFIVVAAVAAAAVYGICLLNRRRTFAS